MNRGANLRPLETEVKLLTGLLTALLLLFAPGVMVTQASQPLPRVVELKASDGAPLKATYFSAGKPGPGVLLFHQRVSIGGRLLRIRFSNEYGSTALRIGAATVASPAEPGSVKPASLHTLTFGGVLRLRCANPGFSDFRRVMIAVIDASVVIKRLLQDPELPTTSDFPVLQRGAQLTMEMKQHLFDTHYHGVALETPDCVLMTADEHYLRAARDKGCIIGLAEWR
jgi:hypothetical protein